ncbi:HAD family hydrolase [Prevotella dentasini]|uniref:HAD family hydrolase n=1 Tax=Prevotella dentasini TaxID=589537 RepID=UPI0004690609|nr:HAD family hydrolase [Prevotella dentasini]
MNRISLIAFDADDTLWDCQTFFSSVEKDYCRLLAHYASPDETAEALFATETANMPLLGYGCKAFVLSLIENAVRVSDGRLTAEETARILELGKTLLRLPGTPLPHVGETLARLRALGRYRLVVFTKGELLDQENKLARSGLATLFDDVVIVSDKTPDAYRRLCRRFSTDTDRFLMVGNSFRSDIAPVLELGGWAVHIPYHIEWQHEVTAEYAHPRLVRLDRFAELADLMEGWAG